MKVGLEQTNGVEWIRLHSVVVLRVTSYRPGLYYDAGGMSVAEEIFTFLVKIVFSMSKNLQPDWLDAGKILMTPK